uniref:Uncharacterized protein n=1 Tax=Mus musculus TaxID=10090 RepID=Q8CES2_MOUSE|nr:RIKEN cDNA 4930474M22 gene [Mus musculus]BAC25465.1 unnamed protein product [Mus musculus]
MPSLWTQRTPLFRWTFLCESANTASRCQQPPATGLAGTIVGQTLRRTSCWVSRGSSRIAGDRGNFCTWDQENQTVSQGKGPKKVQKKIPGKWQIL